MLLMENFKVDIGKRIKIARINPAEGNKVIASLFRLVAVDYGTRETVAYYTWENV